MHTPPIPHLAAVDPQIAELIEAEAQRQHDKLRMIASENYVSTAVL
jgi:glycine hydroxymethyltransferase